MIDPLYEKYYGWTPYQYAGNNPVSMLDNNGYEFLLFGNDAYTIRPWWGEVVKPIIEISKPLVEVIDGIKQLPPGIISTDPITGSQEKISVTPKDATNVSKDYESAIQKEENDKNTHGKNENIGKNTRRLTDDELQKQYGDDFHKNAKKDILNENKKQLQKNGDKNADFYIDKKTGQRFLKGNQSGKFIPIK
jgi:hypothetical protein